MLSTILQFRRVKLVRPLEHKTEAELLHVTMELLARPGKLTPREHTELIAINWELRFRSMLSGLEDKP